MSSKKTSKEHERTRKREKNWKPALTSMLPALNMEKMKIRYRFPEQGEDHPAVVAEMDAICAAGPAEGDDHFM